MQRVVLIAGIVAAWLATDLAQAADQRAADEAAIRKAIDSYVEAYNRGDAKAVADHWSDEGEWVSPAGKRMKGRKAIQREMEVAFQGGAGGHLDVLDTTVRFLTADVAVEEGKASVVRSGEDPDESTYIAIHVKKDGKWKLDVVRETSLPEADVRETPLAELSWLVGDWVDQSADSTIEFSVNWTKNHSFLAASFKLSVPGIDDLEGTQVIGWDAEAGTIRNWTFDSDGGIGTGTWSENEGRWIVTFSQVLADGRRASATNIYTPIDENSYQWESIDREVGDQNLPDIEAVKVVRKGAADVLTAAKAEENASDK